MLAFTRPQPPGTRHEVYAPADSYVMAQLLPTSLLLWRAPTSITQSPVLPLTYAMRATRAVSLNHASFAEVLPDLQALALFGVILPALGVVVFHFTERRARRTGSLGQY